MFQYIGYLIAIIVAIVLMIFEFVGNGAITGSAECCTVPWAKIAGNGPRGVLFISNLGEGHEFYNWNEADGYLIAKMGWAHNAGIQDPIGKYAVTLSFDSPSAGRSKNIPIPGSLESYCCMIHDLADKFLPQEYAVVGHALGGLAARVYQKMYPDNVHDVLLIDPTPEYNVRDYQKIKANKNLISNKYLNMVFQSLDQIPQKVPDNVLVYYNFQDYDDKEKQEREKRHDQYIKETYPKSIRVENKGRYFHVTNPKPIVETIIGFMLGSHLWHGSNTLIEGSLQPRPNLLIGSDRAVFATTERWLALAFIPKYSSSDLEVGYIEDEAYMGEIYEGAFKKIHGQKGYLYKIPSKGFRHDHRLGMPQHEFINPSAVDIVETEYIEDIWKELKKLNFIKFISYGDMADFMYQHNLPQPGKSIVEV